jgi:hypothetical protein
MFTSPIHLYDVVHKYIVSETSFRVRHHRRMVYTVRKLLDSILNMRW